MERVKQARNPVIELIKFIAVCEIACFHSQAPWARYVRVLPIFMVFSICFTVRSHLPVSAQLQKSLRRLIYPWFFWSAVYALAKIGRAMIVGSPIGREFHWWMLASGPTVHLWYLPFAFLSVSAVSYIFSRFKIPLNCRDSNVIAALCGLLVLLSSVIVPKILGYFPFYQWFFLSPAVLAGILYASYCHRFSRLLLNYGLWIVVLCCLLATIIYWRAGVANLIALGVCSFAFSYKPPAPNKYISYLGKISYGVYLVHMLFIFFWKYVGIQSGSYTLILLTIGSSVVAASILDKTVVRRFI